MRCFFTDSHAQLLLCVVFLVLAPCARTDDAVFDAVWSEAEETELWKEEGWWTLLHYHRTLWGQVVSRVDDPRFFIDPRGRTHPRRELRATLQAFLQPPEAEEDARSIPCRFPARRRWLLQRLELPEELFPEGDCAEYLNAVEYLQLESAAMIYPAAYLNSPASMFGHLLLVLDRRGKDRLLSKAVNYAAVVEDSFGPLFAFKGIFGLYDGVFAILPYYDKVEEYSAVNRRDIWEYPLDLEAEELDRLLRHVWELQELTSRYFFFKENCAFNLMYPLEAARSELSLTRKFRLSAVPVTLLRELADTGVMSAPVFRASAATRMDHLASLLSGAELVRVKELAGGAAPEESDTAVMLELASSWVTFSYTERELPPEAYRERVFPLLRARSTRGSVEIPAPPVPVPPHAGHGPRRWMPYAGVETTSGDAVFGFRFRFAYHDGLDDPAGYPAGSSITMFAADVQEQRGEVTLESFTLVDLRSLTPPRPWARPLSWAAHVGVHASPVDRSHHRTEGRFASGFTRKLAGVTGYLMWANVLRHDPRLEDNAAWETGVEWGLRLPGSGWRAGVKGRELWGVLGLDDHRREAEAEVRWSLKRDLFLGAAVSHQRELHHSRNLATMRIGRTF
jgi:hypothetical protein